MLTSMAYLAVRAMAWLGKFLLLINLMGVAAIPMRHSSILSSGTLQNRTVSLSPKEFLKIAETPFTSRQEYLRQVTDALHRTISNHNNTNRVFQVSLLDNYILFLWGFLYPEYTTYEYCDVRKALTRGIGLCSQQSTVLGQMLIKSDIEVKGIQLEGHIVLSAKADPINNIWWILDPDYGVIVPHGLDAIEQQPEIVRSYYEERGYDRTTVDTLVNIYQAEGNGSTPIPKDFYVSSCLKERTIYLWKWLIPFGLLLPWMLGFLFRKLKERSH